jgi:peptide/nickel transport system substrate-binding protein
LARSNDIDGDLAQIVYNSLLKYDGKGNIVPDLAESYDVSDDKLTYTVHLRKNVTWHDGEPFSAADVLFTVDALADPSYKSPLRSNWQGIETNQVDDHTITFTIKNPYAGFLNNLTFGILPKHIWQSVEPEKFHLADYNLEPIGTGPYKYSSFQKDSKGNVLSYKLISNPSYFEGKPYISKLSFNFYTDENSALDAFNRKEIMGVNGLASQKIREIKNQQSTEIHKFNIPRYFAVFFNQTKSVPLANDDVRQALNYATNQQEIIDKVFADNASPINSPFLPGMVGYQENGPRRDFDFTKANDMLEKAGWKTGPDGVRAKDGMPLKINLVTTDLEELSATADALKSQWEKVGARVEINTNSISDIQQNFIKPREYEALLFGQVIGADPDPFSFWHSSQKKDPGLNLSLFGTPETDQLIEQGRTEAVPQKRAQDYIDFESKLFNETPAIFLYSTSYIYPVNKKVQGLDMTELIAPSRRFSNISHWYKNTKRVWN